MEKLFIILLFTPLNGGFGVHQIKYFETLEECEHRRMQIVNDSYYKQFMFERSMCVEIKELSK